MYAGRTAAALLDASAATKQPDGCADILERAAQRRWRLVELRQGHAPEARNGRKLALRSLSRDVAGRSSPPPLYGFLRVCGSAVN